MGRIGRVSAAALLVNTALAVVVLWAAPAGAAELTEANASSWTTFAPVDNATRSVSDDTSHVKVGSSSLRFDTASGYDTGVRYPKTGSANLNLLDKNYLRFWTFAINPSPFGFQGPQPVIVLKGPNGKFTYTPQEDETAEDTWRVHHVPLAGDSYWVRTQSGTVSLDNITKIEIHQDTWDAGFTIYYDGFEFLSITDPRPPGPPPPPGVNPDAIAPKVLLAVFDPIINSKGGVPLHEAYGFGDPIALAHQVAGDLQTSSHDLARYQIVETEVYNEFPLMDDGFRYDEASWDHDWYEPGPGHIAVFDYRQFVIDKGIASRIDSGEIDEVWIYSDPQSDLWESTMAGPGGYWCNSSPVENVPTQRLFVIMGFNYERGVGEAIHSYGHRAESIMVHSYGNATFDQGHNWSKFVLLDKDAAGLGGIGNVHDPVNGEVEYDYGNPRGVPSNADDWANYPNFTGATRSVSRLDWATPTGDWQRDYLNWWYAHMPHFRGKGTDQFLANWWRYLTDPDQFKGWNGNLLASEGVPSIHTSSPSDSATVAGVVPVTADVSVDGALGRVDFYVDGVYAASDTLAPYTFAWNATGLTGAHTIVTKAYELQNGTEGVSAPITVNVVPTISLGGVRVSEGNRGAARTARLTVSLSSPSSQPVTVQYNTVDGSAVALSDYVPTSGTLTFSPGQTARTITVKVKADRAVETDETIGVVLSNPTNTQVTFGDSGVTIVNDDPSSGITASVGDVRVFEGDAGSRPANFTVSLSEPSTSSVVVSYTTANGSAVAPGDYAPRSGDLTFAAGVTSMIVSVPVKADTKVEGGETFVLQLTGATGATLGNSIGNGEIADDD